MAPTAAASVGVAIPARIEPCPATISTMGATDTISSAAHETITPVVSLMASTVRVKERRNL